MPHINFQCETKEVKGNHVECKVRNVCMHEAMGKQQFILLIAKNAVGMQHHAEQQLLIVKEGVKAYSNRGNQHNRSNRGKSYHLLKRQHEDLSFRSGKFGNEDQYTINSAGNR